MKTVPPSNRPDPAARSKPTALVTRTRLIAMLAVGTLAVARHRKSGRMAGRIEPVGRDASLSAGSSFCAISSSIWRGIVDGFRTLRPDRDRRVGISSGVGD